MYHGWIKAIIGVWLIMSGLISYLINPINMMITGFVAAVCCFGSYKMWQCMATGLLGLWLFISGLSFLLAHTHLVTSTNFITVGTLFVLLGSHCILFPYKKFISKPAL